MLQNVAWFSTAVKDAKISMYIIVLTLERQEREMIQVLQVS